MQRLSVTVLNTKLLHFQREEHPPGFLEQVKAVKLCRAALLSRAPSAFRAIKNKFLPLSSAAGPSLCSFFSLADQVSSQPGDEAAPADLGPLDSWRPSRALGPLSLLGLVRWLMLSQCNVLLN